MIGDEPMGYGRMALGRREEMRKPEDTNASEIHPDQVKSDRVNMAALAVGADPAYMTYKGTGHIRTFTHRMVDPFRLEVSDIDMVDCIHAISQLNRFTGHSIRPYSVGEHTLNLFSAVPKHLQPAALIHDWSEAYFNDIASPVKKTMLNYKRHEEEAQRVIFKKMGVDFALDEELHPYDKRICANEMLVLFDPPFKHYLEPLPDVDIASIDQDWRSIRAMLAYLTYMTFTHTVLSDFDKVMYK